MKDKMLKLGMVILALFSSNFAFAQGGSGHVGGGGDANERRVYDIRDDILSWINHGGAKNLKFPSWLSQSEYESRMRNILKPDLVEVTFTESQVLVAGKEKTCRGSQNEIGVLNILCNFPRFERISEAEQYSLIHHEYAGLVGVEVNIGSKSDYEISKQLTGSLESQAVLRLVVDPSKKKTRLNDCTIGLEVYSAGLLQKKTTKVNPRIPLSAFKVLEEKGYRFDKTVKHPAFTLSFSYDPGRSYEDEDVYNGMLARRSVGFFVPVDNRTKSHALMKDQRRIEYETRLNEARTIAQFEAIQKEMDQEFQDIPELGAIESLFMDLPTCDSIYGEPMDTIRK